MGTHRPNQFEFSIPNVADNKTNRHSFYKNIMIFTKELLVSDARCCFIGLEAP